MTRVAGKRVVVIAAGASLLTMAMAAVSTSDRAEGEKVDVVQGASASSSGSSTQAAGADTGTTQAAAAAAQSCTAGSWTVTAPDPNDTANASMPVQYQTTHFAFRYNAGTTTLSAVQAAGNSLENIFSVYMNTVGFPEPYCNSSTKLKTNVFIGQNYGLSGGIDGLGHTGIWMGPGGLNDNYGMGHEYTHALQGSTGSLQNSPFAGWIWESHANWMAQQLPQFRNTTVGCANMSVNYPHLYLGTTRMRYCNWQFMEHLKNLYGYNIINDIWRNAPKAGSAGQATGDPFLVLMANMGWSASRLNDELGKFAMRNVNWDYTNPDGSDQGAVFRQQFGGYDPETNDRIWRTTTLDPMNVSQRRFAVPFYQAPQRWGYNLVRVYPDSGASSITVAFRGVVQNASATSSFPGMKDEPSSVPAPNSGWRWGLVAVNSSGVARYSALQSTTSGSLTMAATSTDKVYMVVTGAPTQMQQIRWDQPFYSVYRYPWMVQFTNAQPAGFQNGAPAPIPGGTQHSNGGGWKAAGANVASTAYVGPYARVLAGTVSGNARIQEHGVVNGGTVSGNAVVGGLTVVRGNTVITDTAKAFLSFFGLGELEQNITLSGNAQNIGDVEQRGASFNTGAYYGFVDQAASSDPSRGSNRTTAVPEVTAAPNYTWY